MKKYIFSGLLLMASTSAFAQMQVDKQIQMTGAAANDRRITNVSNASAVTPVNTDAVNIATFQSNYTNYGAGAFAAGTYSLTLIPAAAQYWEGMIVSFKAGAINTGATNLNINTLGNRAIVKAGGQALVAGDIQANQMVTAVYNLTGTRFEIIGSSGIAGWSTLGNAGTVDGTNFLGTIGAQRLDFRTNNTEKMRITSGGQVSINQSNTNLGVIALAVQNTGNLSGLFISDSDGVQAEVPALGFAVLGYTAGAGGVGVFGSAGGATGYLASSGGSFSSATGSGVYGTSAGTASFGGYFTKTTVNGAGVIVRAGTGAPTFLANSGGSFSSATGAGISASAATTTATGGVFLGQGGTTFQTLALGSGTASAGTSTGVYGYATGAGNDNWGGYFNTAGANNFAYVGGRLTGTTYKINGPGSVSTMVKNLDNEYVNMFCPESPEILFQDYGTGKLENGKTYINIDPILAKNIFVDATHPMKVFIQLEGDCKGVFVTNKTKSGFEVQELQGGKSNVTFSWSLTANRVDTYLDNGSIDSRHQDVRFPKSPVPRETKVLQQSYREEGETKTKIKTKSEGK